MNVSPVTYVSPVICTPLTNKVLADIVFAVNPFVKFVAPLTVPPLNGKKSPLTVDVDPVVNPVTLNVPPVLLVNVVVPAEYVPPVTLMSNGKFKYVVADIVFAVNPLKNLVPPVTVPPLNGKKFPLTVDVDPVVNPVTLKVPPVLLVNVAVPAEYVPPVTLISNGKFK